MKRNLKVSAGLAFGAAAILVTGAAGGAVAGSLITGQDVKDGSLHAVDLSTGVNKKLDRTAETGPAGPAGPAGTNGTNGKDGADGKDGKDGVTNLITGAGYTSTWKAGEAGETIETCPDGQYALGGGYSTWGGYNGTHDGYDLGGTNTDIQVTVSAPYFKGDYVPVDDAGNFRADQWVIRGVNHGDTDQIVRAWVTCATVAN